MLSSSFQLRLILVWVYFEHYVMAEPLVSSSGMTPFDSGAANPALALSIQPGGDEGDLKRIQRGSSFQVPISGQNDEAELNALPSINAEEAASTGIGFQKAFTDIRVGSVEESESKSIQGETSPPVKVEVAQLIEETKNLEKEIIKYIQPIDMITAAPATQPPASANIWTGVEAVEDRSFNAGKKPVENWTQPIVVYNYRPNASPFKIISARKQEEDLSEPQPATTTTTTTPTTNYDREDMPKQKMSIIRDKPRKHTQKKKEASSGQTKAKKGSRVTTTSTPAPTTMVATSPPEAETTLAPKEEVLFELPVGAKPGKAVSSSQYKVGPPWEDEKIIGKLVDSGIKLSPEVKVSHRATLRLCEEVERVAERKRSTYLWAPINQFIPMLKKAFPIRPPLFAPECLKWVLRECRGEARKPVLRPCTYWAPKPIIRPECGSYSPRKTKIVNFRMPHFLPGNCPCIWPCTKRFDPIQRCRVDTTEEEKTMDLFDSDGNIETGEIEIQDNLAAQLCRGVRASRVRDSVVSLGWLPIRVESLDGGGGGTSVLLRRKREATSKSEPQTPDKKQVDDNKVDSDSKLQAPDEKQVDNDKVDSDFKPQAPDEKQVDDNKVDSDSKPQAPDKKQIDDKKVDSDSKPISKSKAKPHATKFINPDDGALIATADNANADGSDPKFSRMVPYNPDPRAKDEYGDKIESRGSGAGRDKCLVWKFKACPKENVEEDCGKWKSFQSFNCIPEMHSKAIPASGLLSEMGSSEEQRELTARSHSHVKDKRKRKVVKELCPGNSGKRFPCFFIRRKRNIPESDSDGEEESEFEEEEAPVKRKINKRQVESKSNSNNKKAGSGGDNYSNSIKVNQDPSCRCDWPCLPFFDRINRCYDHNGDVLMDSRGRFLVPTRSFRKQQRDPVACMNFVETDEIICKIKGR